jgi:membrane AbrB-like protein
MRFSLPTRESVLRVSETLAIGAVGGLAVQATGISAGLIIGSMLSVAVASLASRPLGIPPLPTRILLMALGMVLGGVITPETLHGIATYPISVALLAGAILCVMISVAIYLRLVHRWASLTAVLGASPGAVSQIMGIAAERGLDLRALAVVHMVRVVMLTTALPFGFSLFGLTSTGGGIPRLGARLISAPELLLLVTVSVGTCLLLNRLRFNGAWVFGAMIGSGALHGAGLIEGGLPNWAITIVIISLGCITGSRFAGTSLRVLLQHLAAGFGSFAIAAAVTAVFVALVLILSPAQPAVVIAAFAPGAQDTMMVLALALNLDPVFIGAHHAARFLIVSLAIPLGARLVDRLTARSS